MQIFKCSENPLKAGSENAPFVCPHPHICLEDSELVTLSQWLMLCSELAGSTVLAIHTSRVVNLGGGGEQWS